MRTFRKLVLSLFVPVLSLSLLWPKPSPTPQATAPGGSCSADYYRNSDGVCVHHADCHAEAHGNACCRDSHMSSSYPVARSFSTSS
jgi:hypothetical protein